MMSSSPGRSYRTSARTRRWTGRPASGASIAFPETGYTAADAVPEVSPVDPARRRVLPAMRGEAPRRVLAVRDGQRHREQVLQEVRSVARGPAGGRSRAARLHAAAPRGEDPPDARGDRGRAQV